MLKVDNKDIKTISIGVALVFSIVDFGQEPPRWVIACKPSMECSKLKIMKRNQYLCKLLSTITVDFRQISYTLALLLLTPPSISHKVKTIYYIEQFKKRRVLKQPLFVRQVRNLST